MNRENYEILQVEETASDEEIRAAYERLKAQYNEDKWQDGEEGNSAARMLGKIETAYQEIIGERKEKQQNTSGESAFEEVSNCIRNGDIARAQQLLDNFNERNAEWHYLQSVVFFKKNWMNESKKQLEIAMQMDGGNQKYRDAYEKLKSRADYRSQSGGAADGGPGSQTDDQQMGGNMCANCANFCYTCFYINCLYSICCNCR